VLVKVGNEYFWVNWSENIININLLCRQYNIKVLNLYLENDTDYTKAVSVLTKHNIELHRDEKFLNKNYEGAEKKFVNIFQQNFISLDNVAVFLEQSKEFDNLYLEKSNIKEIIFKKTYEFDNSYDDVEFLKNGYPARSKCFEEVFTVTYQKFQKYFDSLGPRDYTAINNVFDRLINEKPIIYKKNGEEVVRYNEVRNFDRPFHGSDQYDWYFWSYVDYDLRTSYPNIHIYCRYKSAIHKDLR
jgi:hypothetical protein